MLLVTLGLLLGAAALLWGFVLALTCADGETSQGAGFHIRLPSHSTHDGPPGASAFHPSSRSQDSQAFN